MKMSRRLGRAFVWIALCAPVCAAASPKAPDEVAAAAPKGMTLLIFKASGTTEGATGAAVYETLPDANDVRLRTLTLFRLQSGRFVPEVSNAEVIACSKCSQFHDDPFDADYLDVKRHHIHLIQMDGGEKPSKTTLDLAWKNGAWHVTQATRITVTMGRYAEKTERLPLPQSGLLRDMDAQWSVPPYLNTLVIHPATHKFMFLHGELTQEDVRKQMADECRDGACQIAVQQHDGCIGLARDAQQRLFSGSITNAKAGAEATSKALQACRAAGGQACEAVRTDCSVGVLSGDP